jgi:aquaporin Z
MEYGSGRKFTAEFLGTFALVLVGCGSAVIAGDRVGFLGISFAFGLTVLAMVYAIGHISGCHINPAISVAMLVAGRMKLKDTILYVIAQCIGAIAGAAVLWWIASGLGGYSIATALFLIVIFGATSKEAPAGFAGLPIGLALVLIHIVGIPVTGTSVNPARSLGPAVFAGGAALGQLWVFIVAPLAGGIIAALIWRLVLEKRQPA